MSVDRPIAPAVAERVARRLDVLGQEVRIGLIYALDEHGELSVGDLAELVGVTVHDASQHLAILHGEGVVRRRHEAQFVYYRLEDPTAIPIYEQVTARIHEQIEHVHREFQEAALDMKVHGPEGGDPPSFA